MTEEKTPEVEEEPPKVAKQKVELKKPSREKGKKVLLKWSETLGEFIPIKEDGDMNDGVFIELFEEDKKWKYFYIKGAPLIVRRTALRAANGIARTGYMHPIDSTRYGIKCTLEEEVSPYEDLSDDLKKSQRSWYKGHYKEF